MKHMPSQAWSELCALTTPLFFECEEIVESEGREKKKEREKK